MKRISLRKRIRDIIRNYLGLEGQIKQRRNRKHIGKGGSETSIKKLSGRGISKCINKIL